MNGLKFLLLFPVIFAWLSGCPGNESPQGKTKSETEQRLSSLVDNNYIKIVRNADSSYTYEIKQQVKEPILVKKDGSLIDRKNLDDFSFKEFQESSYLLLPKDNKFREQFLENPFQQEKELLLVRPSMWGQALIPKKTELNTFLFEIGEMLTGLEPPEIDNQKLKQLFGNYEAKSLGKGGQGEVFSVTYKNKDYALKRQAPEAADMEKLQFTDGVAKVYAFFSGRFEDKMVPFMIMERGKESLDALDARKERLSADQVLDAVKRFEKLLDAQKVLNIKNTDIKPANLLLTNDNRLVVIDVSAAWLTKGYQGTEGELLARALFENQLGLSLKGGYLTLDTYYNYSSDYRDINIASPTLFRAWNKARCQELLPTEEKCANVNSFDDFFFLIPKPEISKIAKEGNNYYKDLTGTHDTNYLYGTGLPLPNVQHISQSDWDTYFSKREEIGTRFCRNLQKSTPNGAFTISFFVPLKAKYFVFCQQQPNETWIFSKAFIDSKDPAFHEWIEDALSPLVEFETFRGLARTGLKLSDLYPKIIKQEFAPGDPVGQAIVGLYNYKGHQ